MGGNQVFVPCSDSGLPFCHQFRVLLSSCEKRPVVNEKETKSVPTSNSLTNFAQNSNVKGRSQCGGSGECAHTHTGTYIYMRDNAAAPLASQTTCVSIAGNTWKGRNVLLQLI